MPVYLVNERKVNRFITFGVLLEQPTEPDGCGEMEIRTGIIRRHIWIKHFKQERGREVLSSLGGLGLHKIFTPPCEVNRPLHFCSIPRD